MIVRISEQNKLIVLLQSKQECILGGVGWGGGGVGGLNRHFFWRRKIRWSVECGGGGGGEPPDWPADRACEGPGGPLLQGALKAVRWQLSILHMRAGGGPETPGRSDLRIAQRRTEETMNIRTRNLVKNTWKGTLFWPPACLGIFRQTQKDKRGEEKV